MGSQINTNARKADFESAASRTFDFEKILNNDSQDPDENFFNAFNFKDSQHFAPEESKKNSKKNYYTRRLENYQHDIKKSWDVIKEIIVVEQNQLKAAFLEE